MKNFILMLILLLNLMTIYVSQGWACQETSEVRLLVKYAEGANKSLLLKKIIKYKGVLVEDETIYSQRLLVVGVKKEDRETVLNAIKNDPQVENVEEDAPVKIQEIK